MLVRVSQQERVALIGRLVEKIAPKTEHVALHFIFGHGPDCCKVFVMVTGDERVVLADYL